MTNVVATPHPRSPCCGDVLISLECISAFRMGSSVSCCCCCCCGLMFAGSVSSFMRHLAVFLFSPLHLTSYGVRRPYVCTAVYLRSSTNLAVLYASICELHAKQYSNIMQVQYKHNAILVHVQIQEIYMGLIGNIGGIFLNINSRLFSDFALYGREGGLI